VSNQQKSIEQFLFQEAELADNKSWDNYLDLYDENCEFHIPQWDSEHVYTTDPKTEMSLMYYASRAGLEDRVFRIRTNQSAACSPLPRTLHLVNNVRAVENTDATWGVNTNWVTHYYRFGQAEIFFGRTEYILKPHDESWKILRKHALILNDNIKHVLDFYHV